MAEKASDPYSVLLKSNKLPMTLIRDGSDVPGLKQHQAKMAIETSSFADTFGPKSQRKRVKLGVSSLTDLAEDTETSMDTYKERLEQARLLSGAGENTEEGGEDRVDDADPLSLAIEPVFQKGQSKRIWNELYKVLDSSDVVIHVLGMCFEEHLLFGLHDSTITDLCLLTDARNPEGTRCRAVEQYLKKEAPHKHLVFVLNKIDLIPTSVAVGLHPFISPFPLDLSQGFSQDTSASLPTLEAICYSVGKSNFKLAALLSSDWRADWVPFWVPLISFAVFHLSWVYLCYRGSSW